MQHSRNTFSVHCLDSEKTCKKERSHIQVSSRQLDKLTNDHQLGKEQFSCEKNRVSHAILLLFCLFPKIMVMIIPIS